MTRAERDRHAALAASRAAQERAKRYSALRDAAPELLAALELIANTGMDARQCMLTARAAIKKAIGDTP